MTKKKNPAAEKCFLTIHILKYFIKWKIIFKNFYYKQIHIFVKKNYKNLILHTPTNKQSHIHLHILFKVVKVCIKLKQKNKKQRYP